MARIDPAKEIGQCAHCRKKNVPVRRVIMTVDGREVINKLACDECWPPAASELISRLL